MRASVNGTEIFYDTYGQGPPTLVMHGGMGLDHSYFRPWLDGLGDATRLVFYDHRGNGRSEQPVNWSGVDTVTLARDADTLRDHLGLKKIVLFGHSFGGFVAQEYAVRYPERLMGLILCSTAPAFDYADVVLSNAQARATDEQMKWLSLALSSHAPDDATAGDWWREIFPLYFHDPQPAVLDEVARRIRYRAGAWNRSVFDLTPSFNVLDRLREITMPTLVLGGRDDWIMPSREGAERIHAAIEGSELKMFERSGHFPWIEERALFIDVVGEWIGRISTSQPG